MARLVANQVKPSKPGGSLLGRVDGYGGKERARPVGADTNPLGVRETMHPRAAGSNCGTKAPGPGGNGATAAQTSRLRTSEGSPTGGGGGEAPATGNSDGGATRRGTV